MTTLVTAATAPVGRAIVEQLLAAVEPVRALTRDPAHAGLPAGAELVTGDLTAAFEGVSSVFLLAMTPDVTPFLDAAKAAGVHHVVFQSSAEVGHRTNDVATFHHDIERAIERAGFAWTFLRLDVSSSDAIQWAFDVPGQLAAGDVVRGPYAAAAGSPIHPSDFAAVAVAALLDARHQRQQYHITGPVSLTHREQFALIGQAKGRNLRYEELDPAAARAAISPHAPVDLLFETWERHLTEPAPVNDAFARVTGLVPRTPEQWAASH